jgi:hypothetical protein
MLAHRFAWWSTHNFEPIPADRIIAHTCDNGARGCCNPRHLECVSQRKNTQDAVTRGLHDYTRPSYLASRRRAGASVKTRYRGATNANAKLSDEEVAGMRGLYAAGGIRQVDLAAQFGISQTQVSRILRKASWAA